jgi:hypothetical protein
MFSLIRSFLVVPLAAVCLVILGGCSHESSQYSSLPPSGPQASSTRSQKSPASPQNVGPVRDASGKIIGIRDLSGVIHSVHP